MRQSTKLSHNEIANDCLSKKGSHESGRKIDIEQEERATAREQESKTLEHFAPLRFVFEH